LTLYSRAIRSRPWIVGLVLLAALGGSLLWTARRSASYEATAHVLVSPLPQDDTTFLGISLLRDSGDPTRTVQTAATLIDSPAAAALAASQLGRGWTAQRVRNAVDVKPEGQSNVLAVTASADDPVRAARVANVFTRASLAVRRDAIARQVAAAVAQTRKQLSARRAAGERAGDIEARLTALESIAGDDPTLSLSQSAVRPESATGAPTWLVILLAAIAGIALGTGAALLAELLDRRVRDDDELLRIYPLPVLARIPSLSRRRLRNARSLLTLPSPAVEGFRSLHAQLDSGETPRTVMVTSASSGDGKTTAAIGLAMAIAASGEKAILIDLDLRKGDVANWFGMSGEGGLATVVTSAGAVRDLLVPALQLEGMHLRVLPAGPPGDHSRLEAAIRRLPEILAEAKALADYVVVDSPPLGEVSDALRIAREVDDIVLVARPRHTSRIQLEIARDVLERSAHAPRGLLMIGGPAVPTAHSYYFYGQPPEADRHPERRRSRTFRS
jgi:Mrp family chromosome partitioning ATPase